MYLPCSYDRALGGLRPEAWEIEQLQRVGFPLGEQIVHFNLTAVVTSRSGIVRDADAALGARKLDPSHPILPFDLDPLSGENPCRPLAGILSATTFTWWFAVP